MPNRYLQYFSRLVVVACVVLSFSTYIRAQVEIQVHFAKGKYSATYQGKLTRNYGDYDAYVLRARAGQTLSFKLTTADLYAYAMVFETKQQLGPDQDLISAGNDEYPRVWSGKLPVNSEYSVQVYGARHDGAASKQLPYTIEIEIRDTLMQGTGTRPVLPADLSKYVDEYPSTLMKVAAVHSRLKALLGSSYADFELSMSVQGTITQKGDFLFSSGCMPHVCTVNEAAFVVDIKNNRIHAVIYEKDAAPKYFNEDKTSTPAVLLDWVKELKAS